MRELDARVAGIVMGIGVSNIFITDTGVEFHGKDMYDGKYYFSHALPNYSTDHNAAFEVVGTFSDFEVVIQSCEGDWECNFEGKVTGRSHWEGKGLGCHKSLTTAICLAALRAGGDGDWVDNYLKEN